MRSAIVVACLSAAIVGLACGRREDATVPNAAATTSRSDGAARQPDGEAASARRRVVVLGDSLTAGLGLSPDEAYPTLLQKRIDSQGLDYQVINAGVSGDTSAGGLSRLNWALDGDVRVLVVALGGNDALRGLPVDELRQNLARIIETAQMRKIAVILVGMEAPPNFGDRYFVSFHKVYPDLASTYHVKLVPFLLDRVAGVESLNQRDGLHPTAEGARIVADNVWAVLASVLEAQNTVR
jgi:acyl-CoA thioesterase-1